MPKTFNLAEDPDEMVDRSADTVGREIVNDMVTNILANWDPDDISSYEENLVVIKEFIKQAPVDPDVLQDEFWQGPENYGSVDPV